MKKSRITGWKDVFLFTFTQTIKSKSFIITFIFLLVIASVSMPVVSLIMSKSSSGGSIGNIDKVYVINNTVSLKDLDFSDIRKTEGLEELNIIISDESYDDLAKRIEAFENNSIILNIKDENNVYSLDFFKSGEGDVKDSHMTYLSGYVVESFEKQKFEALGVSELQKQIIDTQVRIKTYFADVSGEEIIEEDTSITHMEYGFLYGVLFIIFMVNTMASGQISMSIVSDKSSKVIEYLLTSIKPLALIVGKVLAMLSVVLVQTISMIAAVFISNKVTALMPGAESNILGTYIPKNIFDNFNLINIVICLLLIALGMIFYAALAGLAGACVSRIEETNETMTLYTFTSLAGFYIGIIAAGTLLGSGENAFVTFALIFPLSAPFLLPGAVLIGKVNIFIILASITLLVLFVILVSRFTAKVFETLILHNGNKIGIKELFKMSKTISVK